MDSHRTKERSPKRSLQWPDKLKENEEMQSQRSRKKEEYQLD